MSRSLGRTELISLVQTVFRPSREDKGIAILVDLPDGPSTDTREWRKRRELALDWTEKLREGSSELGFDAVLCCYRNARRNNADLPETCWLWNERGVPGPASEMIQSEARPFREVFMERTILMALTEFSATAPLKLLAREYGFRAATMGGFSPEMIPALKLDYQLVSRRVEYLKDLLDRSHRAELRFRRRDTREEDSLTLDLRHRFAHASGGLLPRRGTAGNLPSGEAYIVPYEGELPNQPSRSEGFLPVEFAGEVVRYRIRENRAVAVEGSGTAAEKERARLARDPAYGNIAELGLGVLRAFGVLPCGSVLLDEKLGLHIAFGRSDHFGGRIGPDDFSSPESVVHIDRVYIPEVQPLIQVSAVDLFLSDGEAVALLREDAYVVDFPSAEPD